jgi:hypothetical protein
MLHLLREQFAWPDRQLYARNASSGIVGKRYSAVMRTLLGYWFSGYRGVTLAAIDLVRGVHLLYDV